MYAIKHIVLHTTEDHDQIYWRVGRRSIPYNDSETLYDIMNTAGDIGVHATSLNDIQVTASGYRGHGHRAVTDVVRVSGAD
jgi:hypothetical protein